MTLLPVVERELRVAARRRGAFWTRLIAAGIAIGIGAVILWVQTDWQSAGEVGSALFQSLSTLAFWFALLSGPFFASDIVSEEKREGTLGLLFLTDLKGLDIVAGKLTAASITAVYSLIAIVPVMAIPILLGGVDMNRFWMMVGVLLNTLFLSLSVAVAVSSASQHARSAFAMVLLLLFLIVGFPLWLADSTGGLNWRPGVTALEPLCCLSPLYSFRMTEVVAPERLSLPAISAAVNHLMAWLFLLWAGWRLPQRTLERDPGRKGNKWMRFWAGWERGAVAEASRRRTLLLDMNPMVWLSGRHRLKRQVLWWFVGIACTIWLSVAFMAGRDWSEWSTSLVVAGFLQMPMKWLMASEATHRWVDDRASGALELLLTTPLDERAILKGHLAGLRRLFGWPVIVLLVAEGIVFGLGSRWGSSDRETAVVIVVSAAIFVWDLHTLAWLGAWQGLVKRKANRAFFAALWRVLLLPLVWMVVAAILTPWPARTEVWFVVCGLCNLWFWIGSRWRLTRHLREAAAGQFLRQGLGGAS